MRRIKEVAILAGALAASAGLLVSHVTTAWQVVLPVILCGTVVRWRLAPQLDGYRVSQAGVFGVPGNEGTSFPGFRRTLMLVPSRQPSSVLIDERDAAPPHCVVPGRKLRIAMMGTRGIPASYSGFETCAEQLSVRLVERGHHVTVYCRSHHVKTKAREYRGVRLVHLPTIRSKHLDTIIHTLLSLVHGAFRGYDVVYICGVGNAPLAFIPRLLATPTILNADGADWQRGKWGGFARSYLRFAERTATWSPSCILADSRVVQTYYTEHFGKQSIFIPYGSDVPHVMPGEVLARFGLRPDGYLLFVGRLVPENNAHDVIAAYLQLGGLNTGLQLCIVGDAPYSTEYVQHLRETAGPGVVFTGYQFGAAYHSWGQTRAFSYSPVASVELIRLCWRLWHLATVSSSTTWQPIWKLWVRQLYHMSVLAARRRSRTFLPS